MKLSQAAKIMCGKFCGEDVTFTGVSNNTRTLTPGDLYFAIRGENFNGHDYIAAATTAGAVAAVIDQTVSHPLPSIHVQDTRKALGQLAQNHRQQFSLSVVALTGSCGKTTTKTLLASILNQCAPTLANVSSYNNNIGVPLTLLQLSKKHRYAVCEMGANHKGEIAELVALAKPDVALITNIGPAHLEGFGSIEGVARAKSEIFQGLQSNGVAVLNRDDAFFEMLNKNISGKSVITFGIHHQADVMASDLHHNTQNKICFTLILNAKKIPIQLQLLGEHNVRNAIAAAACAHALGVPVDQIKQGLEVASAVDHRLVEKVSRLGARVIDDSYNANPLSVTAAISVLAAREGKSVLVLGDMLELGKQSDHLHQQIGETARRYGIHSLYCFGPHSYYAAKAFGQNAYHFTDQDQLISALKSDLAKDITVLVKGSLSMNMTRVANALVEE